MTATRKAIDKGIYEVEPGVFKIVVSTGRDPVTGKYGQRAKLIKRAPGEKRPDTLKRARTERKRMDVARDEGKLASSDKGTVSGLADRYLQHLEDRDRSATTIETYRSVLAAHIKPRIGGYRVTSLTTSDLDAMYGAMKRAGVGLSVINKAHLVLNGMFNQAMRWKVITENPATLASPPAYRRSETSIPLVEHFHKLVEEAEKTNPDFAVLLLLDAATGLRRGELAGLRWSDLDETGTLTVQRGLTNPVGGIEVRGTKTYRNRRLSLDAATLGVLEAHRERCEERAQVCGVTMKDDAYMFSGSPDNSTPLRPDSLSQSFSRIAERAGVAGVTLHSLRHLHASMLLDAGADVARGAKRMGHSRNSTFTDIYGHVRCEDDRDLAELVSAGLAPKAKKKR